MLRCKFCKVNENQKEVFDGKSFDFYSCEECESIVCHMCIETSIKTGKDFCIYCRRNLQYEGKWV